MARPHDRPWSLEEIAEIYDETSFWSARFGVFLLDRIPLRAGEHILDVGCGTGFPVLELAQMLGQGARLVGVDVWREALQHAHLRRARLGLDQVEFLLADGVALPFANGCFDRVVSNLGINNFEHPMECLRECRRVTRPGGSLVMTTNVEGHFRELYEVFREVLVASGGREAELERLDADMRHRGSADSIVRLLESTGWSVAFLADETSSLRYLDGAALLGHSLVQFGFLPAWRAIPDADHVEQVLGRLEERLDEIARRQGHLEMSVPMLYVEATR